MHKPRRAIAGAFYISNNPLIPVGASLLAIAVCQSPRCKLCPGHREQARSHRVLACLREIVENNIPKLRNRDIKPLQIVVLSQF